MTDSVSNLSTKKRSIYILSLPGLLRSANVVLGLSSIILTSIGFENDLPFRDPYFPDSHVSRTGTPYLTYYGIGYKHEGVNYLSLAIISICFSVSVIFLLFLVFVQDAEFKYRAWNRFINLSLAILLSLGWISGILGFLLFRQGCCRVEILSTERITYETEGYREPCLCLIKPHNDPEVSYPVLLLQDSPTAIRFLRADPHHFHGHVLSLVLVFINVITYFGAFVKV